MLEVEFQVVGKDNQIYAEDETFESEEQFRHVLDSLKKYQKITYRLKCH